MILEVYFIDAFTSSVFGGNPAGVVYHNEDLPRTLMQKIALENNLSETAFINTSRNNQIKFFTPEMEVDLCGHATLASAFVYFNHLNQDSDHIVFRSNRAELLASKLGAKVKIDLPKDKPTKADITVIFEEALGVKLKELYRGIDDYLAILEDEHTVCNLVPNFEKLKMIKARGIIVSASGSKSDFVSRWFGPQTGVNEDPVTGSAHALLAPYWASKLNKNNLYAIQASSRGGELECIVNENSVSIIGDAKLYLKGKIYPD